MADEIDAVRARGAELLKRPRKQVSAVGDALIVGIIESRDAEPLGLDGGRELVPDIARLVEAVHKHDEAIGRVRRVIDRDPREYSAVRVGRVQQTHPCGVGHGLLRLGGGLADEGAGALERGLGPVQHFIRDGGGLVGGAPDRVARAR